jgi:hypothetical protein
MRVNLDEIQFYYGPSCQLPSTDAKVPRVHAPQSVQQSFPSGTAVHSTTLGVPLEQGPPLTGTTSEWNVFDIEINNIRGSTVPRVIEDVKREVIQESSAAGDVLLELESSSLSPSEQPPPETPAPLSLEPVGTEHLGGVSADVQEIGLPRKLAESRTVNYHPLLADDFQIIPRKWRLLN